MATSPQAPRPPMAPAPPRSGSHILLIVLLVLALVILVSGVTLWTGMRFISSAVKVHVDESAAGKKEVSIKTPVGSLEVHTDVTEGQLGLPIYPRATRLKNQDSATVNLGLPGEQQVHIVAAKFDTPDPSEKVRDFYKNRLGSDVTNFKDKDAQGNTVFEIKRDNQEKIVSIEPTGTGSRIALVHVSHGPNETN